MRLTAHVRFGGGPSEKGQHTWHLASGLPDPKANGKLRGLGIPVIADRAQQGRVRNALKPEWEARFEPRSYGFRPGRSSHDAIEVIFKAGCGKNARKLWALDADLTAALEAWSHCSFR